MNAKGMIRRMSVMLFQTALFISVAFIYSCHGNTEEEVMEPVGLPTEPVKVMLKVSAARVGDLNKRLYGDDNAEESEFMNTLCVYVVNDGGMVEKVIKPDLSQDAVAQAGNLYEYISGYFELTPGQKTFYAFSNWGETEMTLAVGLEEGDVFDANAIESIVLNNPAGKVNLTTESNKVFIPMTGILEGADAYIVAGQERTIEIGLDRLVGKVRLTLNNNDAGGGTIKIADFAMAGFADKVSLFATKGQPLSDVTFGEYTVKPNAASLEFYVNETLNRTTGFEIRIITDQDENTIYTGRTKAVEIPRNSILPINLALSDLELEITSMVIAPPIGVVLSPIEIEAAAGYHIYMPEGSTFTINASLGNNNGISDEDYQWSWEQGINKYVKMDAYTEGSASVSGTITAQTGVEVSLKLDVSWTKEGKANKHDIVVTLHTKPLEDFYDQWFGVNTLSVYAPLWNEAVNLWKK